MTYPILKSGVKIGIAVALSIILFQVSNIFLVYKYFKFDYYITAVAVLFLMAGFFLSKYKREAVINQGDDNIDPFQNLTQKELAILQMIANGKSNKEIAALNFVEVSTIKTHINNIYGKLGLSTRKEAINYCKNRTADSF